MNKLIILFVLTFLDFISKYFVKNTLILNQTLEINQFFDLVYVQNYGVSFGMLSGVVPYWILIIIGILVVVLIMYLSLSSKKKLEKIAYFIITIGAISNIFDRMLNSFVVDFILIHYDEYYWPAFNFADIYITIGIIVLIVSFFIKSEENK